MHSLKAKSVIIVLGAAVGLAIIGSIACRVAIFNGFGNLETDLAYRDMRRVVRAIRNDATAIQSTCADWSKWDDTYQFVQDRNDAYRVANLRAESLAQLRLGFMVLVDTSGAIVHVGRIDQTTGEWSSDTADLLHFINAHPVLLRRRDASDEISGVAFIGDDAVIMAASPIVRSDRGGSIAGVLLMGRYLDRAAVAELVDRTGVAIRMLAAVGVAESGEREMRSDHAVTAHRQTHIQYINDQGLVVEMGLADIFGRPTLRISIQVVRTVHQQALVTLRHLYRSMGLVALGVAVAALGLLHSQVLRRINTLSERVRAVGHKADLGARVNLAGRDEVGELASRIDSMLTALEDTEIQRRKLEEHLRHQRRLESLATLSRGVAHEINNPLNGIMNYAQLMLDGEDLPVWVTAYADEVMHESRRIATLINGLQAFSRVQVGEPEPADMQEVVMEAIGFLETTTSEKGLTVETAFAPNLPAVLCRRDQIRQIVVNLLINARDALNERHPGPDARKVIKVMLTALTRDAGPWVRITVEDHGNGIPESIRHRVFDPFFTTKDRSRGASAAPSGAGLGLAISHGIAQEHGGALILETQLGEYTRFHLDLPSAAAT